jgi:hypothetical protein
MSDPQRLLDDADLGANAKRVLESARDVDPPPGAEDALWLAIATRTAGSGPEGGSEGGPAGGSGVPAAGSGAPAAGVSAAVKAAGIVGALAVAGVGAWIALAPSPRVEAEVAARSEAPPPVTSEEPIAEAPVDPVPTAISVADLPPVRLEKASPPARSAPEPSASSPPAPAPEASDDESSLLAESRAIRASREALRRGDADAALRELAAAAARFPDGALVQEREVLLIEALSAKGRTDEARTRAEAFLVAHPRSPFESRVRPQRSAEPAPRKIVRRK